MGRRSPHGERGLKFGGRVWPPYANSRSPHGERGLKLPAPAELYHPKPRSLPSRGAWIEIYHAQSRRPETDQSLPSRGAWIEIEQATGPGRPRAVAPLTGSVD